MKETSLTYRLEPFVSKIVNPVVCVTENGDFEFENGRQASQYQFDEKYLIESVKIHNNKVVLKLVINDSINDTSWTDDENISFFE